jgi:hypothetical protein
LTRPLHPGDAIAVLEIVIASDSGSITGSVVDEKSRPVRGAQAVLVPIERAIASIFIFRRNRSRCKVNFAGVAPGDYKLLPGNRLKKNSWFIGCTPPI